MATNKISYPAASTTALTFAIGTLASDSGLLAGRASTAVDNTTTLDLDHIVSGSLTVGTTPTASTIIEVYAYAAKSIASNVPTYPDSITGTDATKTMSSRGVMGAALRQVGLVIVDSATTGRVYDLAPTSIAALFGGVMPRFWGLFVVHNNVAAMGSGAFQFDRVQTTTA